VLEQTPSLLPVVVPLAAVGLGVALWMVARSRRKAARRGRANTASSPRVVTRGPDTAPDSAPDSEHEAHAQSVSDPDPETVEVHYANFDEAPLAEVERAFEILVAQGRIRLVSEGAGRTDARALPEHVGSVYRRLLSQTRRVELVEVQVSIALDACVEASDPIGGWRLDAMPEEIDIRIAPSAGEVANPSGDVILDATWSPRGSGEIMVHSTLLHFLVRSVAGDRLPS
jgi:hypothetical protein